ncbi:MAG TPA: FAD-dependent thymidylate synthase [Candidatus Paceibacterota bacterium]
MELKHVTRNVPGGGFILVLNTGAVITPEAEAMLQALHSRSTGGVREHLNTLAAKGPEKFMQDIYVGYGHKSIGDCGTGTVFIENVSMLVAKAIQDWCLYSGQESSTRYLDFAEQAFIDPVGSQGSHEVLEGWREFYLASQESVRKHLRALFPRKEGEDEKVYEKAIHARSFDILRGFLPAGASTNLAWHTNLRQAADHLALLRHHPLSEVRSVADAMEDALREAYPSSFGQKRYGATEEYSQAWMQIHYLLRTMKWRKSTRSGGHRDVCMMYDTLNDDQLAEYQPVIAFRPRKTELPKQMAECGTMQFEFLLDFGSFRDIQRHRSVIQRMPLLTSDYGIHPWYLKSLPEAVAHKAQSFVQAQLKRINALSCGDLARQYYLPMGMCVPCRLTGDLPALVYIVELRAQATVHPTLHEVALSIGDILKARLGEFGLNLYVDCEPGRFDIKRGRHDIVCKK